MQDIVGKVDEGLAFLDSSLDDNDGDVEGNNSIIKRNQSADHVYSDQIVEKI